MEEAIRHLLKPYAGGGEAREAAFRGCCTLSPPSSAKKWGKTRERAEEARERGDLDAERRLLMSRRR